MTTALEGGEGSASRPGRSLPQGKTRYPLYRRLGGLQGRSGQVRNISPPPGFDPRTVQPVASRYTDWATQPTWITVQYVIYWNVNCMFWKKNHIGIFFIFLKNFLLQCKRKRSHFCSEFYLHTCCFPPDIFVISCTFSKLNHVVCLTSTL